MRLQDLAEMDVKEMVHEVRRGGPGGRPPGRRFPAQAGTPSVSSTSYPAVSAPGLFSRGLPARLPRQHRCCRRLSLPVPVPGPCCLGARALWRLCGAGAAPLPGAAGAAAPGHAALLLGLWEQQRRHIAHDRGRGLAHALAAPPLHHTVRWVQLWKAWRGDEGSMAWQHADVNNGGRCWLRESALSPSPRLASLVAQPSLAA